MTEQVADGGRVSKHPDVRREEILAKSLELFTAQGFDQTSIQNITDAVGVAKGLFYHYFDSKQDVLNEAVDWQADAFFKTLPQHAGEMEGDALAKIRDVIGTIVSWKLDDHRDMIVTYLRVMYRPENLLLRTKLTQEYVYRLAPLFGEIIREGVEEGVCDVLDADMAARSVFAMWVGGGDATGEMMLQLIEGDRSLIDALMTRIRGWEDGVERLLGIETGTLGLYDYGFLEKTLKDLAGVATPQVDDGIPPPAQGSIDA
jgi:AcrR family transcriptional regulator